MFLKARRPERPFSDGPQFSLEVPAERKSARQPVPVGEAVAGPQESAKVTVARIDGNWLRWYECGIV